MRYEGSIYRPPSEAYSLIVQATIGCSHNKCAFCSMYKDKEFRIRQINEILEDLEAGKKYHKRVDKVFLADGNALALSTEDLRRILIKVKELFPECRSVGAYSSPKDLLRKSLEELKELQGLGLSIVYLGIESGSDHILSSVAKGATAEDIISAGKKAVESGIKLSATIISGIGGRKHWKEHAIESARVINEISPHYLALLTLLVQPGTKLYNQVCSGEFELLTPKEVMEETAALVENLTVVDCVFRSNHASNYVSLAGILPLEKEKILDTIRQAIDEEDRYKFEIHRRL